MPRSYSIYEAKSKLSEMVRLVKRGLEVIVTERGNPVAKVIPYSNEETVNERLNRLEAAGYLRKRKRKTFDISFEKRPGGLRRFLEDRE